MMQTLRLKQIAMLFARELGDTPGFETVLEATPERPGRDMLAINVDEGAPDQSLREAEAQVIELRQLNPRPSLRVLATQYGVSHTAIRRALSGEKWRHVR